MKEKISKKTILLACWHHRLTLAVLEDDELAEIQLGQVHENHLVGSVYKGRVINVLPGMQAAFVDIGLKRNSFLHVGDVVEQGAAIKNLPAGQAAPPIEKLLKQGQEILVQVTKEPVGVKGARVTMQITLPGHKIVLMPTVSFIGVSHRIEGENKAEELMEKARRVCPDGKGMIIRTIAEDASEAELSEECKELSAKWESVKKTFAVSEAPKRLYQDASLLTRVVRDMLTDDVDKLVVNDEACYRILLEEAQAVVPELAQRIVMSEPEEDIFEAHQIYSRIQKALARKVWLKCGGYVVFDQTEALTVVDVNTGKFVGSHSLGDTILQTNLEAADEIARQLRLRNISGIIVIDFIDMAEEAHKEKLLSVLREALKKDRLKTNVLGITQLGLVEMTRKKRRNSLAENIQEPCLVCEGTGRVMEEYLQLMRVGLQLRRLEKQGVCYAEVRVHPKLASALADAYVEHREDIWTARWREIYIIPDWRMPHRSIEVKPLLGPLDMSGRATEAGQDIPVVLKSEI